MFSLIQIGALPNAVYCFTRGEKFTKSDPEGYEACPSCGEGFNDLSEVKLRFFLNLFNRSVLKRTPQELL